MEFLMSVYAYFAAHQAVLFGFLFALSEVLALIPGIQSNSVYQLFVNAIKKLAKKQA